MMDTDTITLRVDGAGRLLAEPATMVMLECECCAIRRGQLAVGDLELCVEEHGPTMVASALETAIVG